MREERDSFSTNVFINCPFDPEYNRLLRPLLFTILQFGFTPKIASERSDGGEFRLAKITGLIQVRSIASTTSRACKPVERASSTG
jgi:hypothetical protein